VTNSGPTYTFNLRAAVSTVTYDVRAVGTTTSYEITHVDGVTVNADQVISFIASPSL